jgi:rhodanese-related sulfurtransferase
MIMRRTTFLITALMFILCGCGENEDQYNYNHTSGKSSVKNSGSGRGSFRSIPPHIAQRLIDTRSDLLIIDVRTPGEMKYGRITGSTLMSFWSVMRGQHDLPKDKAIILVCAVGGRSYTAGQVLVRNGYGEIYNLSGGIKAWRRAGLPLKY